MDRKDVQQRIQERAYDLWEAEGRPAGRDIANWLRAEVDVLADLADRNAGTPKPPGRPSGQRKKAAATKAVAAKSAAKKKAPAKTKTTGGREKAAATKAVVAKSVKSKK